MSLNAQTQDEIQIQFDFPFSGFHVIVCSVLYYFQTQLVLLLFEAFPPDASAASLVIGKIVF